jgi:hypothetical protein
MSSYGPIHGDSTLSHLNNNRAFHAVTGIDIFNRTANDVEPFDIFTLNRYSNHVFQGIMPDTGAAGISTAGIHQVQALQHITNAVIDTSTAGQHNVRFGAGNATSIGTVTVETPIGSIDFQVLPTSTPFLLSLQDMDAKGVQFDNVNNVLIQGNHKIPITRRWGHPWLQLHNQEQVIAQCHLTEVELRQLHRRFGHPSVKKLSQLLTEADEDFSRHVLLKITKFCHHCQLHGRSPGRFKFNIKDDVTFNAEVVVDVMYLDSKPVLHVVDNATAFQAARFLRDMAAATVWETLQLCWLNVYTGPPDLIIYDAGTC